MKLYLKYVYKKSRWRKLTFANDTKGSKLFEFLFSFQFSFRWFNSFTNLIKDRIIQSKSTFQDVFTKIFLERQYSKKSVIKICFSFGYQTIKTHIIGRMWSLQAGLSRCVMHRWVMGDALQALLRMPYFIWSESLHMFYAHKNAV